MNTYFKETKKECRLLIDKILQLSDNLFDESNSSENSMNNYYEYSSICSVNNSLIQTLTTIKEEVLEGKINNLRSYSEADLNTVDVLLAIYLEYGETSHLPVTRNLKKLTARLKEQLTYFKKVLDYFPEDLGINVKRKPRIISKISLDYYQLIYLALSHSYLKFQGIKIQNDLQELASKKRVC